MTTKRILTKGLLPALLLSAALSVPATSVAAPSPHGKAHAAEKVKQNRQDKAQRQAARQARQHAQKAQAQAVKAQRNVSKAQRKAAKAQRNVVVVPQRRVAQRRVVVAPQRRVIVPQRRVVTAPAPPVYIAPSRRPWQGWNNRYSRYGSGVFQLEGTYIGPQYGCGLLQDPRGQVIPLLIDPKEFRKGDHVVMSGRIQNSSVCGTAFRVFNVDSVNGGDYYVNDRYRGPDRYRGDPYYDDDNRNLVSIAGRLDDSGRCPVIRGDHGEYYDLVGDLRNFRAGDHARVIGFLGVRSRCGGQAIDVQEID